MFILLLIAILLFFLGVQVKYRKQYWLIAGYNYAAPEEQEAVRRDFAGFAGNIMFLLAAVFVGWSFWLRLGPRYSNITLLFPALLVMIVAVTIYKANNLGLGTGVGPKKNSKMLIIALIVLTWPAVLIVAFAVYTTMPGEITVTPDYFEIGGASRIRQEFAGIEEIKLYEHEPVIGRKIFGTDAGKNLRGRYEVEGYGEAVINLRLGVPPYIHVLTKGGKVIIINRRTSQETVEVFEDMLYVWEQID